MTAPGSTLLAFDYGRRRIGVAVGNTLTGRARPLETVAATDAGPDWERVAALLAEWNPGRLVVGVPYNDAGPGDGDDIAAEAQRFARRLHGRFGLPVQTVDERLSSAEAYAALTAERRAGRRGRIAKQDIDSAAAAVILQDWLDNHS
ncbi:MAG: Holliday junction resolvase RuvX [Gammaproteobacteria bacterium]|jgi:putative Holliday junction resolvase